MTNKKGIKQLSSIFSRFEFLQDKCYDLHSKLSLLIKENK